MYERSNQTKQTIINHTTTTLFTMSSLPGANIAKHLLPLTPEEQSLLDLYNEVRAFEKLAAQARSDASKAVLVAADEEYQKKAGRDIGTGLNGNIEQDGDNSITQLNKDGVKNSKKSQNKKKKSEAKKVKHMAENDTADVSGDESDNESDGESNLIQAEKERLRQMKLEQLRGDVEEGLKEEQKNEEEIQQLEQRRNEFLRQSSSTADSSITIQRKNKRNFDNMNQSEEQEPSLLANINHMTTPPHDFSKSLKMNRVTGKQLFPEIVTPSSISTWSPPEDANAPDEGCLELELPGFDPAEAADGRGNNTLAIKFTAPRDSRRFSINLATPDHANYYSVLFHFNPRQFEKGGQVVLNDKQSGIWGQGIDVPLSTFPLMFGEVSCTIIIQIHGDGFDVFMDGRHCARLEHRAPLPQKSGPLILQFPSTDDYGSKYMQCNFNKSLKLFVSKH